MKHQRMPPQAEGLEMIPLGHVTQGCHSPNGPQCPADKCDFSGEDPEEKEEPSSLQLCCQAGEHHHCLSEDRGGFTAGATLH